VAWLKTTQSELECSQNSRWFFPQRCPWAAASFSQRKAQETQEAVPASAVRRTEPKSAIDAYVENPAALAQTSSQHTGSLNQRLFTRVCCRHPTMQ